MTLDALEYERERLEALLSLSVLDTPPEPFFDAITAAAARACDAPVALVSLVDDKRQWFKSKVGLDVCETPREISFCTHAIRRRDPLLVPDAANHPDFCDNPLVTGPPYVRAYLGAPIVTRSGHAVGTLCVIHHAPTTLSQAQIEIVTSLAASVASHLELRNVALTVEQTADTLRRFVVDAPVAMAMFDRSMTFIATSARWANYFHKGESPAGRGLYEVLPGSRERYGAMHEATLKGGRFRRDEDVVYVADGREIVHRWEMQPWRDRDGAIGGVLMVTEDITAVRETARRLDDQTRRLGLAMKVARCAVWEFEPETGRIVASDTMSELLGSSTTIPPERLAQAIDDVIHPADRDRVLQAWLRHLSDGAAIDIDFRFQRLDGGIVWMRAYAERLVDPQTGQLRHIGLVKDVDGRKQTELALALALHEAQDASRTKDEFLANISHEIRTPLNGVIGVAGVLAEARLPEQEARLARLILESGSHLERLLSDLLDLAKAQSGRLEIEERAFNLAHELTSAAELLRPKAASKRLSFEVVISMELNRTFHGDPVRLKQIMTNLVSNAVKFTQSGAVSVRAALEPMLDETILRLEVADTGIGFAPDIASRLFERFTQADASISRRFGGTGLGLSITKSLVELMGGEISVVSSPGAGSTFLVRVPLRLADAPAHAQAETCESGSALKGLKVLVVDDHMVNRTVVELSLAPFGVDLTQCASGMEALDALEKSRFDLVLMDMHMPEFDGLSVIREARRRERAESLPRSPIVMLSASATPRDRELAALAGADGFIAKPVTPERLIVGVLDVLRKECALYDHSAARSGAAA